jgi:type IV pilus assembly protein PilE
MNPMFLKHQGLTLIEVLITLAILAIITAIAIPAYNGYIASSRNTEGWENLAAIKLAEEEYFLENNSYFTGADTAALESNSGNLWKATGSEGVINFDYSVTPSAGGYTAKAKGNDNKVPSSVELTATKD